VGKYDRGCFLYPVGFNKAALTATRGSYRGKNQRYIESHSSSSNVKTGFVCCGTAFCESFFSFTFTVLAIHCRFDCISGHVRKPMIDS